ncbi:MAG TPA: hypothetical protein VHF69_12385 [Candidatus Synoicihabitans sp.]|nr:hypothetical protein [Candidatus Synoicihabitans sp.]
MKVVLPQTVPVASLLSVLCFCAVACGLRAQPSAAPAQLIVSMEAKDHAAFEQNAIRANALGATHVIITEDMPIAYWMFDSPGDPYPAWFAHHAGLLVVFPPKELQPFVNLEWSERAAQFFEERCRILRKHGLKAYWHGNQPEVLPEEFFVANPELRGPRIDQPNRARIPRFAACVDQPETLRLYHEAMRSLQQRCPEVEIFHFVTTDAGSGLCWSPGLYPGLNGPAHCEHRPMEERIAGFLKTLRGAAREQGRDIAINIQQIAPRQWMIPSIPPVVEQATLRLLEPGLAVNGREAPEGARFATRSGGQYGPFRPVLGVIAPDFDEPVRLGVARRHIANFGDASVSDLNIRIFEAWRTAQPKNQIEHLQALRGVAVAEVGEAQADDLMEIWKAGDDVNDNLDALEFGPLFRMGHLLTRWITRPMVPFPEELTPEEKATYRPFLFQAKSEAQADNLIDVQAMRMYEGFGARLLFQRVIEISTPRIRSAMNAATRLREGASSDQAKAKWTLQLRRLEAVLLLLHSADNMVKYQAQLDRVKALGVKPETNPPLGAQSDWDRTDLMQTAREEIDVAVRLRRLLTDTREPILTTASNAAEEYTMLLGPDVPGQLKAKIDLMNARWGDYDRLFTVPNP